MKEQIEEMRNEQIGEMAKALMNAINEKQGHTSMRALAEALYTAGYCKQKEGVWKQQPRPYEDEIMCSVCGASFNIIENCTEQFDFCPNCGAKMRGGKNE